MNAKGRRSGKMKNVVLMDILKASLLTIEQKISPARFYGRMFTYAFFVIWGCRFIFAPMTDASNSFMHWINLPMHEAGHIIFIPLGDFMRVLGGTLMQLLMPTIALCALLIQNRDPFGASIATWWLGQNFMDIAPYINDARAGELMLLGGVTGKDAPGYHDWENMLGTLGLLEYDHMLAYLSYYAGVVMMLASFVWGAYVLYLQSRNMGKNAVE